MDLEEIRGLPDRLDVPILQKYFNNLFIEIDNGCSLTDLEISEVIQELAERQFYTYELIDDEIGKRIEIWISRVWPTESFQVADNIMSSITYLGLELSYGIVKNSLNQNLSKEVRQAVNEWIEELGDSVADPYSSWK